MLGKRQLESKVINKLLDVSSLKSGLYMVEIKNEIYKTDAAIDLSGV